MFLLNRRKAFISSGQNTVLLCHFDGSDGATTSVDSSTGGVDSPHTLTLGSGAELDTSDKKVGTASLLLDGTTGANVLLADSEDWPSGTGDWTIEMWAKKVNSNQHSYMGQINAAGQDATASVYIQNSETGEITASVNVDDGGSIVVTSTSAAAVNSWEHVALVADGNTLRLYMGGVQEDSASFGETRSVFNSIQNMAIGSLGDFTGRNFDGWIDEVRFSNVARYKNGVTFTPPTAPFE